MYELMFTCMCQCQNVSVRLCLSEKTIRVRIRVGHRHEYLLASYFTSSVGMADLVQTFGSIGNIKK